MKLLYFSDAHLRATTPKSRTDIYPSALWDKFQQISELIVEHNIQAVLNGGDLFETPVPAQEIINQYLDLFTKWDVPIYGIVGSHDKFGYNNITLPRTGLGALIAAGVLQIIDECVWLDKDTQIAGVSHIHNLDKDPANYYRQKLDPNTYMIQICHGMLTNTPYFSAHTMVQDVKTEADLVLSGHYHVGFGPIVIGNTTFLNIGSLGRTDRTPRWYGPGVVLIDTCAKEKWQYIALECGNQDDVFIDKIDTPQQPEDFSGFIESLKLRMDGFEVSDIRTVVKTVGEELSMPIEVIEQALQYIEDSDVH